MAKVHLRHQRTPTVIPAVPFDPKDDAEKLRAAMKGLGCDKKELINILAYRSNGQRLKIISEYKTLFGRELVEDLISETKGNFENLLVAMMTPVTEFYTKELHRAMAGVGTDEGILIEILCTMSNHDMKKIKAAYKTLYDKNLEDDIKGDTSGTFKRLMISLCNANRDESMETDLDAARTDAKNLYEAGEMSWGTEESVFNAVLCQRNWAQLQLVFQQYERVSGHDIEEGIKNEFSGNSKDALLAIVRCIKNDSAFFAQLLNKSMKGLGTDDKDLIRLVVTRSEYDMIDIKKEYIANYQESLASAIQGDCSGDYKNCLLHLIREA